MKITIRRATDNDATLLAELGAQTFYDSFAADNTPENMAAYLAVAFSPEKQISELNDPQSIFLIAEAAGDVAGYAKLYAWPPGPGVTGANPLELARLYATPAWLGRGIGAALMPACLTEAENRGHDVLWLGVWQYNPRALAFYRRWGFVEVGRQIFQLGADPQTDLVLQRQIAPNNSP